MMAHKIGHHRRSRRSDSGFTLVEMLAVTAVIGIMAAIAVQFTTQMSDGYRLKGNADAIIKQISLAKIRASAQFTRARVYVDLNAGTSRMQVWQKATPLVNGKWVPEGGVETLGRGVTFGFAGLTQPPPNTQAAIKQSEPCTDDGGVNIADTACITFNSRGMPVENKQPPNGSVVGNNALYITNGNIVYGVTVTATPYVSFWWSPGRNNQWVRQ
jgi:prepilin-type N-terminal cleavage/methylation domain-containing protein